jgi:hypothetical protein
MGTVEVVVPLVFGEHLAQVTLVIEQVTLVIDEDAVGALAAYAAHPAFGDRVRPRCPYWG